MVIEQFLLLLLLVGVVVVVVVGCCSGVGVGGVIDIVVCVTDGLIDLICF